MHQFLLATAFKACGMQNNAQMSENVMQRLILLATSNQFESQNRKVKVKITNRKQTFLAKYKLNPQAKGSVARLTSPQLT